MSEKNISESGSEKPDKPEVRYVPVEYMDQGYREEDEISLIDLIKVLWEGRKTILITTAVVFTLGLFVFLFGGREYESDAILIQEEQQGQSQIQALAQQFGGFGGGGSGQPEGVIPPSLYPRIMESADFMLEVVSHEVTFEELNRSTTPLVYFNEIYEPPFTEKTADFLVDYTIKLPITLYSGVRSLFSGSDDSLDVPDIEEQDIRFLSLNKEQREAIKLMQERMVLEQDGNLVTFKINMPDAVAAAELNDFVIKQIQDYVVGYRIEKYRQNMEFVENQMEDAKQRYEEAQLEMARFSDRNVNITTAVARTQQEDLQNRRNVTFNVYNTLAQELEQSRIRLQEQTPVFNVLQKPSLPHTTGSGSILLLILSIFLGGFLGIFIVFAKNVWNVLKENLKG
ncbi:MAG: Wzz/FepE/Etk N-terminal domain-containing protein [Candidatus Woykebacteria bacterium]